MNSLNDDTDRPLDSFFTRQRQTLTTFFAYQMIDVPLCFQKVKSLYVETMSTPELRLITMAMRHGRRSYIAKHYSTSLHHLTNITSTNLELGESFSNWRLLVLLFTKLPFSLLMLREHSTYLTPVNISSSTKFNQNYELSNMVVRDDTWFQELLFDELLRYLPLFSFYVSKVDKLKRKHSRGKSGKYSIGWKYIPKYKRLLIVLRWLVRDIRFQKTKTIKSRLIKSFENLLFSRESHLVYQLRGFVHKFVFHNFRKTLLKTLRSTS